MAGTLIFKVTEDLKRIIKHANENDPGLYYGTKIGRSVYLVKDRGCYLMSAGQPGLLRTPGEKGHGAKGDAVVVQYAEGFHGDIYDYNELHAVCGGDDFGEPLDADTFSEIVNKGATEIHIHLTETKITISHK